MKLKKTTNDVLYIYFRLFHSIVNVILLVSVPKDDWLGLAA